MQKWKQSYQKIQRDENYTTYYPLQFNESNVIAEQFDAVFLSCSYQGKLPTLLRIAPKWK